MITVEPFLSDAGSSTVFGHPCLVRSAVDAVAMRLGNTRQQMLLSPWRDYSPDVLWHLRTGAGVRTVHAQFKDASDAVTETEVPILSFAPASSGRGFVAQRTTVKDTPGVWWRNDFSDGPQGWASYYYWTNGNVFYPLTHDETGGHGGAAAVWADDSMWTIDTPESPHSVLALLSYHRWHFPAEQFFNPSSRTMRFRLRGENLDLKGGHIRPWLLDLYGRWWKTQNQPVLVAPEGQWSDVQEVVIGTYLDWTRSFEISPPPIHAVYTDLIQSWGIGFRGFSAKPTGRIGLCEFSIS